MTTNALDCAPPVVPDPSGSGETGSRCVVLAIIPGRTLQQFRRCPRNGKQAKPGQHATVHCTGRRSGRCHASLASPETGHWLTSQGVTGSRRCGGQRTGMSGRMSTKLVVPCNRLGFRGCAFGESFMLRLSLCFLSAAIGGSVLADEPILQPEVMVTASRFEQESGRAHV